MRCPICDSPQTRVLRRDPTMSADGDQLFCRRRECCICGERFNTYEGYERPDTTAETRLAAVLKDLEAIQTTIKIHIKRTA